MDQVKYTSKMLMDLPKASMVKLSHVERGK